MHNLEISTCISWSYCPVCYISRTTTRLQRPHDLATVLCMGNDAFQQLLRRFQGVTGEVNQRIAAEVNFVYRHLSHPRNGDGFAACGVVRLHIGDGVDGDLA